MRTRLLSVLAVIAGLLLVACTSATPAAVTPPPAAPTEAAVPTATLLAPSPTVVEATATATLAPTPTLAASTLDPTLLALYDYDASAPLDVVEEVESEEDGVTLYDVSYQSDGRTIKAYLVVPDGEGPFPAVLFAHPSGTGRSHFKNEALNLSRSGVISLLVTHAYAPPFSPQFMMTERDYEVAIEATTDIRRGLDYLATRPDVDMSRVAYVGVSVGGTVGANVVAVDRRVKAAILMSGLLRSSEWATFQTSSTALRRSGKVDAYLEMMEPIEPVSYIGHAAPTALFFQFGSSDTSVARADANRYVEAATEPKQVTWYRDGHLLNGKEARADRLQWLSEQLGFTPLDAP